MIYMEPGSAERRIANHAVQPERSRKKMADALRKAAGSGPEPIMPTVCDPQGRPEARLDSRLASIEPALAAVAAAENGWEFSVCITDKARQTPINKLGGFDGAGDAALEAYWECVGQALAITSAYFQSELSVFLRVSSASDEGVIALVGKDMDEKLSGLSERASMSDVFREAWAVARGNLDLSAYTYSLAVPGSSRAIELDLRSFSQVLRHPDMVVSWSLSASDPAAIRPYGSGFIGDAIRKLENDEVAFYSDLPAAFRIPDGGRPEVLSPFGENLSLMAERDPALRSMAGGCFIEIKLRADERYAVGLLPFTSDHNGFKGTRKGYAEIFSRRLGMRGLNTFIGKARANSVLSPIAQTMGLDVGRKHAVIPSNGGYLGYWLDLPPTEETRSMVLEALRGRLHSDRLDDAGYTSLALEPDVMIMDATGVELGDVRAKFILQSLGRAGSPAWLLGAMDFIPNFVENVHPDIQKGIYDALGMSAGDRYNIGAVERICGERRTVRDAEDLIWTLRMDDALPEDIKARKEELEGWLFGFAEKAYHRMFELLTESALRFSSR